MNKHFTIDEANRALALVRPIVFDITKKMHEAQGIHAEVQEEKSRNEMSEGVLLGKFARAEKLLNEVEYHMKELESVGVLLKDLKRGLVDFPTVRENRIVYLCWMFTENSITHWHETSEGYGSRKMLDETFKNAAAV